MGIEGIDLTGKLVQLFQRGFPNGVKAEYNLFRCTGGFGCYASSTTEKVFGHFVRTGEKTWVRRCDVEKIVEE